MTPARRSSPTSTVNEEQTAAAAPHSSNRPGMRTQSHSPDGNHHMQLTEDEIAIRVGLPGPVIAELLQPATTSTSRAPATRCFSDNDVLRAQVAALMLACGVRWQWVQTAMRESPTHPDSLRVALDYWSRVAPSPLSPRQWPFAATALVTALMTLALLAGMLLGLHMTPQGLL